MLNVIYNVSQIARFCQFIYDIVCQVQKRESPRESRQNGLEMKWLPKSDLEMKWLPQSDLEMKWLPYLCSLLCIVDLKLCNENPLRICDIFVGRMHNDTTNYHKYQVFYEELSWLIGMKLTDCLTSCSLRNCFHKLKQASYCLCCENVLLLFTISVDCQCSILTIHTLERGSWNNFIWLSVYIVYS